MTENTLDKLFEQARSEAIETSVNDIRKWIGLATVGAIALAVLTKFKLVLTKKLMIMLTSTIVTTSIGVAVYVAATAPSQTEKEAVATNLVPAAHHVTLQEPDETPKEETVQLQLVPASPLKEKEDKQMELPELQPRPVEQSGIGVEEPVLIVIPKEKRMVASPDNIGSFHALSIHGAVHVVLTQGDAEDVRISGPEE